MLAHSLTVSSVTVLSSSRMAQTQSKWLSSGQFKQTFDPRHLPNVFLLCGLLASQMSQWLHQWGLVNESGGLGGATGTERQTKGEVRSLGKN